MIKSLPPLKIFFLASIPFVLSLEATAQSISLDKDKQALVNALEEKNIPVIQKLAKKIYHYDLKISDDVKKVKPLLLAIHDGWNDIAMQLIIDNVGLNDTNNGQTALMYACSYMRSDIVPMLLNKGLNPNQLDNNGKSILASIGNLALWNGPAGGYDKLRYVIADALIKHGANVNSKDQPIFQFCNDLALLKLLIKHGADYKATLKQDNIFSKIPIDTKTTLLHFAAVSGNKEVINYLLDLGLSVNKANGYGWTPLHFAAYEKNFAAVEVLLQKGADKTIKTTKPYQCFAYSRPFTKYESDLTPYDIVVSSHYNTMHKKQLDTLLIKLKMTK